MNGNSRIDKRQLCDLIAQYAQVDVSQATTFVDVVFSLIQERLALGDEVTITGLGRFHVVESSRGVRRVAFVPDEKLRAGINSPFACFEPVVIGRIEQEEAQSFVPFAKDSRQEKANLVEAELPSEAISDTNDVVTDEPKEEVHPSILQLVDQSAENVDTDTSEGTPEVQPNESNVVVIKTPEKELKEEKISLQCLPKKRRTRWYWGMTACFVAVLALSYVTVAYFQGNHAEMVSNERLTESTEGATTPAIEETTPVAQEVVLAEVEDTISSLAKASVDVSTTHEEAPKTFGCAHKQVVENNSSSLVQESSTASQKAPVKISTPTTLPSAAYRTANDGSRAFTTLGAGERLTLIAQREYGDKAFWCYIFEVNRDRLKSPSHVTIGCKLYLPSVEYWKIDAADSVSVKRARQRCANLLNEYKNK